MRREMRCLETDVLIIGSGLAGLRAAVESTKSGARTMVISKSGVGVGCNSVLVAGGFAMAASEFTVEDHIEMTLAAGKNLNDREMVQELAEKGAQEAEFLKSIGVHLDRQPSGYELSGKENSADSRVPKGVTLMRTVTSRSPWCLPAISSG